MTKPVVKGLALAVLFVALVLVSRAVAEGLQRTVEHRVRVCVLRLSLSRSVTDSILALEGRPSLSDGETCAWYLTKEIR